jgi:hypothetical protein
MARLFLFRVHHDPCYDVLYVPGRHRGKEGRMEAASECLTVYRELADQYDRLGQVSMRDRFLMLAASAALEAGQPSEAERLRQRLLAASRHHMLRPYGSFAEAARAPDVDTYLRDLEANYPLDDARELLGTLRGAGQTPAPARPIPPTAPLLDLDAPRAARREEAPAIYPLRPEEPPAPRPRAQPLPGQRAAPSAAPRPPIATPVAAPAQPLPVAVRAHKKPAAQSIWLSGVLMVIAVIAGLALVVFTLARPFLPAGWLP